MKRNRTVYFMLVCLTIAAGLLSRRFATHLPEWVGAYVGDSLWALMVFWGFGWLFMRWPTRAVALAALFFSFLVELSQLSQIAWLHSLRVTRLGGLILGYGFLWSDLLSYVIGVSAGYFFELIVTTRKRTNFLTGQTK